MSTSIHTVTISTLRRKTDAVLKMSEERPIMITRYGKPAFVLMSADHYKQITGKAMKS